MKRFFHIFLLLAFLLPPSVWAACTPSTYLSHGLIEGKYYVSILASCDNVAMADVKVTVYDKKGMLTDGKTNKSGEFLFNLPKPGGYFFNIEFPGDGNKIVTDRKVVYRAKPNIFVTRKGNNYTICSEQNFGQFEIENKGKIEIVRQIEGCATYTTDSNRFVIKTPETDAFDASETEAGMFIKASYPEKVLSNQAFFVKLYDNSQPLQGAYVEIAGTKKTTDSKGIVSFILKTPTSYKIRAWKPGLEEFNGEIIVVSELERLEVSHPAEAKPLEVFSVEVKSSGQPVSDAIVSVGGIKKLTDDDGIAKFAFAEKGNYIVTVSKEGFEGKVSSIKVFAEEKKIQELIVSMPKQAYEDRGFVVKVSSEKGPLAGASIKIADKTFTTNNKGEATITGIPAGTYAVSIEKEGFKIAKREIEIIKFIEPEPEQLPNEIYYAAIGIALFVLVFGAFRLWQKRRRRYL